MDKTLLFKYIDAALEEARFVTYGTLGLSYDDYARHAHRLYDTLKIVRAAISHVPEEDPGHGHDDTP